MSNFIRRLIKEIPFARPIWQRLRKKSKWELIDLRDQKHINEILGRLITKEANVIDVGANRGEFMSDFVRRAPNGTHFAFEPVPGLAADLVEMFPRVTVMNAAVSDAVGETDFHVVENNPALSGIARRVDLASSDIIRQITVPLVRLDDVIPHEQKIDFIKIDVEGAELNVFRGARTLIRRTRPHILFEHGLGPAACYQANSRLVFAELANLELQVYRLDSYLDRGSALTQSQFCDLVNSSEYWNWIAAPMATSAGKSEQR